MQSPAPIPPKRPGVVKLNVLTSPTDFKGSDGFEFSEGDVVYILSTAGDQYKCKVGSKEGMVPKDFFADSQSIDHPLHEAAKRGNLNWLKELIKTGISVNTLDAAGNSALFWACRCGHIDCAKVLLAANPVLDQQNKLGDTCLHGAAWGGHAEIVSLLMSLREIGDLLKIKNNDGHTSYDLAKTSECAALLIPAEYVNVSNTELNEDSD